MPWRRFLVACWTTCGLLGAARGAAAVERPNVLILVVDTLRADALGWVDARNATPALDRLAREGFRFAHGVSPVPMTLPAHTSIFSGQLPRRHGVRLNGHVVGAATPLLAQSLKAAGYRTAAFVSGFPLRSEFGLARGFDHYDDAIPSRGGRWLERPGSATVTAAVEWIDRQAADAPWFVFVHLYDPHLPYGDGSGGLAANAVSAYHGDVAAADAAAGQLLAAVARAGAARGLLTIFTSDHGESLGEHGEDGHGFFLYEETVRVPIVLRWPGHIATGRSDEPARLIDLAPTVLAALGIAGTAPVDGQSLWPILRGARGRVPDAYLETLTPLATFGWAPLRAWRTRERKLIVAPRLELFDLEHDPREARNRFDVDRRAAGDLARRLRALEADVPETITSPTVAGEEAAALRSLGYLGGGAPSMTAAGAGLPDPKDRLALKRRLEDAEVLAANGKTTEALAAFDGVLSEEANNPFALLRSGAILAIGSRALDGIGRLSRLVAQVPDHPEARFLLADAWLRLGRGGESLTHWRALVRLQPGRAAAWSGLGAAALSTGDWRVAVEALERAVALAPREPVFTENLAEALVAGASAESESEEARRVLLRRAMELDPAVRRRASGDPRLRPLVVRP